MESNIQAYLHFPQEQQTCSSFSLKETFVDISQACATYARMCLKEDHTHFYCLLNQWKKWTHGVFYSIYLLLVGHEGQGCKNRAPWWQTKNTSLEQTMCVYRERSENKNQSKQLSKRGNCTCTDWDEKLDNVKEMNGSARRRTILFHFCFLQSNPSPTPCLFPHLFSLIPYHSSPIATLFPTPIHRSLSVVHFLLFPFAIPYPPFPYSLSSFPRSLFSYFLSPTPYPLSLFPYPFSLSPFPRSLSPIPLFPIPYSLSLFPYSLSPIHPFPYPFSPIPYPPFLNPFSPIPYPLFPIPYPLFL